MLFVSQSNSKWGIFGIVNRIITSGRIVKYESAERVIYDRISFDSKRNSKNIKMKRYERTKQTHSVHKYHKLICDKIKQFYAMFCCRMQILWTVVNYQSLVKSWYRSTSECLIIQIRQTFIYICFRLWRNLIILPTCVQVLKNLEVLF